MSLFIELKRRNVFRVGLFYVVTAWLVTHELREANRYYYQWHMGNLNLARNVIERLNGGGE